MGKKKYCPTTNTRAMSTAAKTARFSVLIPFVASSEAGPSRLDEMDDNARGAKPPAPDLASHRARGRLAARTRSTPVRSGPRGADAATAIAGKQGSRSRSVGRVNSRASWAGNRGQRLPQLPEQCRERLA